MPRRRARLALVAALAVGLTLALPAPAWAATTVAVEAGYGSLFAPGRSFPVRVEVRADRLVAGSLEVVSEVGGGRRTVVSLAAEVPGGSAKSFLVVVPPQVSFDDPTPGVRARLLDQRGREVARSTEVGLRPAADQELVGLLPGALAGRPLPAPAPLAVDAGVARFVAVGPAELARAPFSLGPLGTLAVAGDELGQLGPAARDGVLRWVAGGGRLLVDAPAGARVEGLPELWQPAAGGPVPAGRGEVVSTDGAVAAGRWAGLVEPTWPPSAEEGFEGESVGDSLADDAGLRVPDLGWLLGFLLLYLAVVGPGTAVVLRRRRRPELAWVVIPLVAVLFTTASWVGGRSLRRGTRLAHATVVELTEAGAWSTSFVGVAARGAQTAEVSFGERSLARTHGGLDGGASVTSGGATARLPLDAGEFGVVRGDGPVELGGLEVSATSDADGRARGTVRNGLPFALDHVVVLVGGGARSLGSLAAGEEREWAVAGRGGFPEEGQPEVDLWGRDGLLGDGVNLALWQSGAGMATDAGARGPGVALVAGWTREFVPPVAVAGRLRAPVGPTVVVGRAPVRPAGDVLTDLTISRAVVRGFLPGLFARQRAFDLGPGDGTTVLRFTLPAGASPRPLVARAPAGGLQAWVDGAWVDLAPAGGAVARQIVPGGRFGPVPVTRPPGRAVVTTVPGPTEPTTTVTGVPRPPPPGAAPAPAIAAPAFPAGVTQDYAVPAAAVASGRVFLRLLPGADLFDTSALTLREVRP